MIYIVAFLVDDILIAIGVLLFVFGGTSVIFGGILQFFNSWNCWGLSSYLPAAYEAVRYSG